MRKSHVFVLILIIIVFISCSKVTGPGELLVEPQPGADYEYTISGVTFHMKYVPPKSFIYIGMILRSDPLKTLI